MGTYLTFSFELVSGRRVRSVSCVAFNRVSTPRLTWLEDEVCLGPVVIHQSVYLGSRIECRAGVSMGVGALGTAHTRGDSEGLLL